MGDDRRAAGMAGRPGVPPATGDAPRHLAVIAGSGMGGLGTLMPDARAVSFQDIAGVGACSVDGHRGEVRTGWVADMPCTLVLGRRHVYENAGESVAALLDHLRAKGVTDLVVTSAAGALARETVPGEVVVVNDLIDLQHRDRFIRRSRREQPSSRMVVDATLRSSLEQALSAAGVRWRRGNLLCASGPAYETPAEVRLLQELGADLVTMSAAPEVAAANARGIRVAVAGVITNPGTGIAGSVPGHDEVLTVAGRVSEGIASMILQLAAQQ